MKGIVLAGGTGSRLAPMDRLTNKHCLLVYDQPMISYPLKTLAECGIEDVLVVTGGPFPGDVLKVVGDGKQYGFKSLQYAFQARAGGIAEALALGEGFADGGPVAVILGDNLFEFSQKASVRAWAGRGAKIHLCRVRQPQRFGVARFEGNALAEIIEKPAEPPGDLAVVGLYLYDSTVFDRIRPLSPSDRGELEVTAINNSYLADGALEWTVIDGQWRDCGTPEALYLASTLAREMGLEGAAVMVQGA